MAASTPPLAFCRSLATPGFFNSATGAYSLANNISGNYNTANGYAALYRNTADYNTANGYAALYHNTTGSGNVANGYQALLNNTTGNVNMATGFQALLHNTTGSQNTVNGYQALFTNTEGGANVANGDSALLSNTTGNFNTASGSSALHDNTTGSFNIALGPFAGDFLTTGNNNIDIGNPGVAAEAATIRIGTSGVQTVTFIAGIFGVTTASGIPVLVNNAGKLGTTTSSARFKQNIQDMGEASDPLLALRPVTFHYKQELDPDGIAQFGLVAEEVEKVNAALVVRDAGGKPYTVRYDAVNAMLLNEFLKAHRKMEEQQKQIDALTAQLNQQAALIQKVSDKLEVNRFTRQVVVNEQ